MSRIHTEIAGHKLSISSDTIKCQHCDKSKEIPDLLRMSSGFREIVYKLYLIGQFSANQCSENPYSLASDSLDGFPDLNKQVIDHPSTPLPDPYKTKWTTSSGSSYKGKYSTDNYVNRGRKMMIDGESYYYHGDESWTGGSSLTIYETAELIEKHGESAFQAILPPDVIKEKKDRFTKQQNFTKPGGMSTDISNGGQPSNNSVNGRNGGIDSVTVTDSAVSKFVQKLKNQPNHFLTR